MLYINDSSYNSELAFPLSAIGGGNGFKSQFCVFQPTADHTPSRAPIEDKTFDRIKTSPAGWKGLNSCHHSHWDGIVDVPASSPSLTYTVPVFENRGNYVGDQVPCNSASGYGYVFPNTTYSATAVSPNTNFGNQQTMVFNTQLATGLYFFGVFYRLFRKNTDVVAIVGGALYYAYTYEYSHKCRYKTDTVFLEEFDWFSKLSDSQRLDLTLSDLYINSVSEMEGKIPLIWERASHILEPFNAFTLQCSKADITEADLTALHAQLKNWQENLVPKLMRRPSKSTYGNLVVRAAQNIQYVDVNSIAYLRDLAGLAKTLGQVKSVLGQKKWSKAISSALLFAEYGPRLTALDTDAMAEGLARFATEWNTDYRKVGAQESEKIIFPDFPNYSVLRSKHVTIYYTDKDSRLLALQHALRVWDLDPTAENLWDLVPFSFVVDWFANLGDLFSDMEAQKTLGTVNVYGAFLTYKDVVSLGKTATEFKSSHVKITDLSFTVYDRKWYDTLPSFQWDFSLKTEFVTKIPELASIIILKTKS